MRPIRAALVLLLSAGVACGDDDNATTNATSVTPTTAGSGDTTSASDPSTTEGPGETTSASATTGEPTDSGSTTEDGGPMILSFGTNVTQLTEGETVIFSAVVTDPDGIEDVIGGQLTNPDGSIVYGSFATAGMESAYEISVTWAAIHQTEAIEFEGTELPREFRAEFYDQGGKKAAKTTTLTFHCDGIAACAGACADLANDIDHCGTCARACEYVNGNMLYGEFGTCSAGQCQNTLGSCIVANDGFSSCSDYCESIGEQCVEEGCYAEGAELYFTRLEFLDQLACDALGSSNLEFGNICGEPLLEGLSIHRCCCTDNV